MSYSVEQLIQSWREVAEDRYEEDVVRAIHEDCANQLQDLMGFRLIAAS